MHEELCCIEFFVVIAGRKQKFALLEALSASGARLMHVAYGRGSIHASHLKEMLGLVPEEQKVLITCLLPRDNMDGALDMLVKQFHFDKPNTGIAFSIPIERLA